MSFLLGLWVGVPIGLLLACMFRAGKRWDDPPIRFQEDTHDPARKSTDATRVA